MNKWEIILTFTYPYEAHLVEGKLETEGIPVQIRDKFTVGVNIHKSNAFGGVKLLVQKKNYDRAKKILIEFGQIRETEQTENKLLKQFDIRSSKLPFIGKSIIELRLIIIVALLLIVIITLFIALQLI